MLFQNYTRRAFLAIVGTTQVNFGATDLTRRPIVLCKDGRIAALTTTPTPLTITGGAGVKYVYADLGAPAGTGWRGFLTRLIGPGTPNRADWWTPLTLLVPNDQTLVAAAHASGVTLAFSTTAPGSETTEYRIPLGEVQWDGAKITSVKSYESEALASTAVAVHGQCRLSLSGGNAVLLPYNGNNLLIDGTPRQVPQAGVSLAPTGLTPGTDYFLYAFWTGSAIALEASTTGHATDANGIETKSGDGTRTLVGGSRVIAGPAWGPGLQTASWFNRLLQADVKSFASNQTRSASSYAEIGGGTIRVEFWAWADEAVTITIAGRASPGGGAVVRTSIGIDSATAEDIYAESARNADPGLTLVKTVTEGYHWATLLGASDGTNTSTWTGHGTAGLRTTLRVARRG